MISTTPKIIKFCKRKNKKQSTKIRVLKYSICMVLVIFGCAATLALCVDDTPPIKTTERFLVQDAPPAPQKQFETKNDITKTIFDETGITLPDVNNENQRLIAQRDIRQLIYPIYRINKPFNAKPDDSCYVSVNKSVVSVIKCNNAVVKRFLEVAISKYEQQLSAVFENNKLKFKILLKFE
ncbi:hypothetical protein [Photobacterium damselae]|uniref:hypothetical protein n=1 Tax=Photobacterium damselae TaxID=38293 RepID=UPI001F3EAAE0|nr:hypothetical protein [Photobacterium damselae]UKA04568.1 hypothetical protein IHC89_23405 [Photobacterium damselae subsp. damselae]